MILIKDGIHVYYTITPTAVVQRTIITDDARQAILLYIVAKNAVVFLDFFDRVFFFVFFGLGFVTRSL